MEVFAVFVLALFRLGDFYTLVYNACGLDDIGFTVIC